jgi:hypothetical protein
MDGERNLQTNRFQVQEGTASVDAYTDMAIAAELDRVSASTSAIGLRLGFNAEAIRNRLIASDANIRTQHERRHLIELGLGLPGVTPAREPHPRGCTRRERVAPPRTPSLERKK